MLALRSVLFLLFQAVTVVPYGILCLLMAPLPLHVRYRVTTGWPRIVLWAARVICGIRWQVKGWENLPNGPAVLLSKHQSTWETFFYISYMPKELCFVFKRELLWVPFFGWGIGLLKMIHIDRSQGRDAFESVVQQGQRKLDEGRWIIMFPEGTRIPRGRRGGSRLAIRTAAPVIPMAVNSAACWPKRPWIKRPGLITVSIGPPIASDGLSPEQLSTAVEHWIEAEMRRIDPDAYHHTQAVQAHEATA
jgi:1-acyl-sn-glycerol-3-phosphate acyltransferase